MDNKHNSEQVADGVGVVTSSNDNGLECLPAVKAPVESIDEFSSVSNPSAQLEITFKAGYPPNIEAIARVLPEALRDKGVIFTYGRVIYVANGKPIPKSLIAHETVHVQQQDIVGRDEWWDRYLRDKSFRFQMELAAHRMEHVVAMNEGNRHHRRMITKLIAKRLAGPLYGNACSTARARRLLTETTDYGDQIHG